MALVLGLLALLTLLAAVGAFLVYRRLRRFGRLRAGVAGIVTAALLLLLCPIPERHGFTSALDILLGELRKEKIVLAEKGDTDRRQAFRQRLEARFAGAIPYTAGGAAQEGWQEVIIFEGGRGWLEMRYQLVWSEAFPWPEMNDFSLDGPKAFCRRLPPAGFWTLPSEAEMVLFWQTGGAQVAGGPPVNAVSFSIDEKLQSEIPSVHRGRADQGILRCVARTAQAPARGYIDADIPLADWNRYQLAKTAGFPP